MPPVMERGILEELSERRKEIVEEGNVYLKWIYTRINTRKRPKTFEELLKEFKTLRYAEGDEEIQLKGMPIDGRPQVTVLRTTRKDLRNVFKRLSALFHLYKVLEAGKAA